MLCDRHTIRAGDPGDKMSELHVVLDDCGDAIVHPLEGEGILSNVVVRKPLDEVHRQNWRSSKDKRESRHQVKQSRRQKRSETLQRMQKAVGDCSVIPFTIQEWENMQWESRNSKFV